MSNAIDDDLTSLSQLDDQILLSHLKKRYSSDQIYTYVGDILIALNPYKALCIYGKGHSNKYTNFQKKESPPHIFAIASSAFKAITDQSGQVKNQCILVSGESGAGKTESTKFVIKQLAELSHGNSQIEQQILQVNTLLEAFGNAQTLMNDNSSRFGKFIQLKFRHGSLLGAKISEYLLEKSRIVRQYAGELNFHVFYYMLAGLPSRDLHTFKLDLNSTYRYLSDGTSCLRRKFDSLKMNFDDLVNSMDLVGFSELEQEYVFKILSGVLTLGNIVIDENESGDAVISDSASVKHAAIMFGIDNESLYNQLLFTVNLTRGEKIQRNYNRYQAQDVRDALSKMLYGRLFGWIVNKINYLLAPTENPLDKVNEIGILDIFGFEHFKHNSFEQACINLANEQLQYYFNQHVFKLEQEEYMKEGIDWTMIQYADNKPLLDLFLSQPIGIFSLLNEESHFPQASDQSLVEKLNVNLNKNQFYKAHPNTSLKIFTVSHYAGKVNYNTDGWLEKNRDTLPSGIVHMLKDSTNQLINIIFNASITRTGSLALQHRTTKGRVSRRRNNGPPIVQKKVTVSLQFKSSLEAMMERMTTSTPSFVRCIKTNQLKMPNSFDNEYVSEQLLYTGMLETTKIRRDGFAIRPTFAEFVEKYKLLASNPLLSTDRESCILILSRADISGCHCGKTKVFLKLKQIDQLSERFQFITEKALVIQRFYRGYLARQFVARRQVESERQILQSNTFMSQINHLSDDWFQKQNQLVIKDESSTGPLLFDSEDVVLPEFDFPPPPPDLLFNDDYNDDDYDDDYDDDFPPPPDELFQTGDSTSDSDVVEDSFTPPAPNHEYKKFGRKATKIWFRETQAESLQQADGAFHEWFHGIITRRDAESLLSSKTVGCFQIRVSESRFGFSLSFKGPKGVLHYMIDQTRSKKYVIVGEPKAHRSLVDLVTYHHKVKISNYDGLLTAPCGQTYGECDYTELVAGSYVDLLEGATPPHLPERNYSMLSNISQPSSARNVVNMNSRGQKKRLSTSRHELPRRP